MSFLWVFPYWNLCYPRAEEEPLYGPVVHFARQRPFYPVLQFSTIDVKKGQVKIFFY